MQRFEIFKPGSHTSAGGAALTFSEADLAATVAAYDPAKHEAPIVVGHPKDNHPAYGWVGKLEFADGALQVDPKEVDPAFAEMVQAGRFKKRSASFYAPDAKANPVPGVYYLRHVGFLGAQPPAVKGLRDVAFSDDGEVVEFSGGEGDSLVARMFSGLRDFLLVQFGQEKADQALPKFAIQDLERLAAEEAKVEDPNTQGGTLPAFTEESSMTPEQITALQAKADQADAMKASVDKLTADNAKLAADFSEAQTRLAAVDQAAQLATIKAGIEPLVREGKVLPAELDTLTSFAAALDDKAQTFSFGEGDKAKQISARALFMEQLRMRPKAVDFSERAGGASDETQPDSKALVQRARAFVDKSKAAGQIVSFTEAVDTVLAGKDQ
jgi:hypothetical protein